MQANNTTQDTIWFRCAPRLWISNKKIWRGEKKTEKEAINMKCNLMMFWWVSMNRHFLNASYEMYSQKICVLRPENRNSNSYVKLCKKFMNYFSLLCLHCPLHSFCGDGVHLFPQSKSCGRTIDLILDSWKLFCILSFTISMFAHLKQSHGFRSVDLCVHLHNNYSFETENVGLFTENKENIIMQNKPNSTCVVWSMTNYTRIKKFWSVYGFVPISVFMRVMLKCFQCSICGIWSIQHILLAALNSFICKEQLPLINYFSSDFKKANIFDCFCQFEHIEKTEYLM